MSSAFISAMDSRATTENGALCVSDKGVGSATLALFFKSVRGLSDAELRSLFKVAAAEANTDRDKADLVVIAFQTRGTRGKGKGEKDLFYSMMELLTEEFGPAAIDAVLPLIPHYGYYKDYLALLTRKSEGELAERMISIFVEQLKEDEVELQKAKAEERTPKLSLAGKYAPREGGAFNGLSRRFARDLFGGANAHSAARKYRKLVLTLNAALNTTECLMAANRWEEIKFASVSSLCLTRHRKAFLNEKLKGSLSPAEEVTGNRHPDDPARTAARAALREALSSKKGVQGKTLQPHEIAQKCMHGARSLSTLEADLLDSQWVSMRAGAIEAMGKAVEARSQAVLDAVGPSTAEGGGLVSLKRPSSRCCPSTLTLARSYPSSM